MSGQNQNDDKQGSGGPNRPSGGRGPAPNFVSRNMMGWLLLLGLVILLFFLMQKVQSQAREISPGEFLNHANNAQFTDDGVVVEDERMVGELAKETPVPAGKNRRVFSKISTDTKEYWLTKLDGTGVTVKEDPGGSILWPFIFSYGPIILILLLLYFFVFRSIRNAGGGPGMLGSFGRSRHRVMNKEHSNVTMADVAGITESKEEVEEIIEFLKNPKKFQRLGGRVPRGVLLIGAPGCGKTLLAKAVAGEADVPFFSISGSDFVEMFVGVGASRVRDLFKQAKDSSPCIIFLDEIDAVGRRRGSGFTSGGHDEREQTLNAILVEMDGFDTNDQVIVVAATNRNDVLDPALTRPGRFDRQIHVPLPDVKGRMEILKVHTRRIKMGPNVDLHRIARGTPMFSGADLAAIVNESAILATLAGKDYVEMEDFEEARDKIKWGRARKSHKPEEEERKATAYHEAGHAIAQMLLENTDPLHKVTIIPRGQAMGATMGLPKKDRYGYARKFLHDQLRVLCAGRIAEQKQTDDVTSGAAMDIKMATGMARHMILEWGMSDRLGFVNYGHAEDERYFPEKEYSEETAKIVDEEIRRLTDEAYEDTRKLIDENWDKVQRLAEALLRYETLAADEVERLMRGEELIKPTVGDLLAAEQDKAQSPDKPAAPDRDAGFGDEAPGGAMPSPA